MKNHLLLSLSVAALLGFAGCARYKAQPLNRLEMAGSIHGDNDAIYCSYYVFSKADCKRYLDRNVIAKGYQPVHITIHNDSNQTLLFKLDNFSFVCEDADVVARKVHTNTVGRAVGYGVASLVVWPLLIPAIVDGVGSSQANERLDDDFDRKALRDQTLHPHSTVNGLIFVANEYFTPSFTLNLTDRNSQNQYTMWSRKAHVIID